MSAFFGSDAWQSYSPTYSAGSGTLTTVTTNRAVYSRRGSKVDIIVDFTLTDAGTGGGELFCTGPVSAAGAASFSGFENVATGATMRAGFRPADLTKIAIAPYDNVATPIGTGRRFILSGSYEAA